MYLYPNVRIAREKAGLSQAQAGLILGTTQQQYYKYEKGVQEIPAHDLMVLADHYGCSVDYLLGRSEAPLDDLQCPVYDAAEIARRIKARAKARGVLLSDMLGEIGVSKNAISTMLHGSVPKADSLAQIADYLGCSVDDLLGRTDTLLSDPQCNDISLKRKNQEENYSFVRYGEMSIFWSRFYALCEQRNTKPNPAARVMGISSGAVTRWKNGGIPNGEALYTLANYFDCSVDYLLGRTDLPETNK